MKNPFRQFQNQDKGLKKESTGDILDVERLLESTEKNAEIDFDNFEKSNGNFINREKNALVLLRTIQRPNWKS